MIKTDHEICAEASIVVTRRTRRTLDLVCYGKAFRVNRFGVWYKLADGKTSWAWSEDIGLSLSDQGSIAAYFAIASDWDKDDRRHQYK